MGYQYGFKKIQENWFARLSGTNMLSYLVYKYTISIVN